MNACNVAKSTYCANTAYGSYEDKVSIISSIIHVAVVQENYDRTGTTNGNDQEKKNITAATVI